MDSTNNFQTALTYAKQNPDDPRSVELRTRIERGDYNEQLKTLGKPTFQDGQRIDPTMGETISNRVEQTVKHPVEAAKGFGKGVLKTAKNAAGGLQDIGQGILVGAEHLITGKPLEETAAFQPGVGIEALKQETPEGEAVDEALAPSNEAQAGGENIETGAEIFYGGGKQLLEGGIKALGKGATKLAETPAGEKVVETGGKVIQKGKDLLGKFKKPDFVTTKTGEQIMATPETKLNTLSPQERNYYFKTKQDSLAQAHDYAQETVKKQMADLDAHISGKFDAKITDLDTKIKDLDSAASTASIEEAQALKPKLVASMRENSDMYKSLVDEELAPVRGDYKQDSDIIASIKEKYASDPYKADAIIDRLNLTPGKTTKIGEIYDNIKGLRQETSAAGKRGTRTFTVDDMHTNDAIASLSDYLKGQGVDLSKANKFWANYAPLRDKLVSHIQPFTPKGAEKGTFNTFTDMIRSTVEKPDPKNANFIKATEDLLGTKIGSPETRAALEKLSATQKSKIATEIDKQMALDETKVSKETISKKVKSDKEGASAALDEQKFSVEQQAAHKEKIKDALKTALKGAGIILGVDLYKEFTH